MIPMETAEKEAVEELKRRTIKDVTPKMLEDELLFYRFCKARDFNVAQAESMLRKNIAWRKEVQIDTISTNYTPPEVLLKYDPSTFLGFTKDGCLVRYIDAGGFDLKGLINSLKKTDVMKYFMLKVEEDAERVISHRNKPGSPLLMYLPIFDCKDMSYANATNWKGVQIILFIVKSYMDNYPERLKCALCINASSYLTWVFALMKQILPSTVKQKIRFCGTAGWKEDLLEMVEADDLPAFLGGNKTDPDGNPLCKSFVRRGQPIPEIYYMRRERNRLATVADVQKLTILPFSKEMVSFEVNKPNSLVEWEFEVKTKDIEYSIYFKEESQQTELVPKQRTDTVSDTEKGIFKCEKAGTYTIEFDNSYSWIHSKHVLYKAKIRTQGEVTEAEEHAHDVLLVVS